MKAESNPTASNRSTPYDRFHTPSGPTGASHALPFPGASENCERLGRCSTQPTPSAPLPARDKRPSKPDAVSAEEMKPWAASHTPRLPAGALAAELPVRSAELHQ